MATRKVKDAKDLDTGELIYIKGHAKATYMSDGRTVEDAINAGGGGGGGIAVERDPIFSASPAASITEEKINEWNSKSAQGEKGDKGDKGDTGVGVQSVAQTTISNADGGSNVVTVTLTNGTTSTFTVKNGSKGSQGIQGEQGPKGDKGDKGDTGTNGTNGKDGADGANGATFTPSVDSAGNLSWTNNKGLTNPPTVNIKGPKGDTGEGGGGTTEVYVADFTMEELRQGADNGVDVECHMLFLIQAMNANKVILVRESADSSYQGVYVLNGYAEDMLYFSIVDTNGEIIYCDGTDYHTARLIQGSSLRRRSFDEKQDALVSGTNIKTINGESILGEGDMLVGKITYFSEEDIIELSPNVVWLRRGSVVNSVQITGFASNGKDYEEYAYHFYTGTIADGSTVKLILPKGVKYANKEIFDALESDTHYELSVVRSNGVVKAVLTAFK